VPPDPVITGPTTVYEGETVHLTCTTPDSSRDIIWSRGDGTMGDSMNLDELPFEQEGLRSRSTLSIKNITMDLGGMYVCRVGLTMGTFEVLVTRELV